MPAENKISKPEKELKQHFISEYDRELIKKIAARVKKMREEQGYSYESFAQHAGINRNSYFRLEKSALTGDNFTIALLSKVIKGLNLSFSSFFKDL